MFRIASATMFALSLQSASAQVPNVVTDTPVVHSLVSQVMDGVGQSDLLLDRGADAHDFQLRPSQAAAVENADIVIWIGPELAPWLDRALAGAHATEVRLLSVPGTQLRPYAADEHTEDGGEAHGNDPHAWLDPQNAEVWLPAIAEALSAKDLENANKYRDNARKAVQAVAALDEKLAADLRPAQSISLGVYHEAYGYFASRYGLTIGGSIASGDAHDPGAAHMMDLETKLAGAACIFPEAGHDSRATETLSSDTGIRVGPPLDPEGRFVEPGPELYAQLLNGLAQGILACITHP